MGDPKTPGVNESLKRQVEAVIKQYPQLLEVINSNILPSAEAQFGADQAVAPGYAGLERDIYRNFAPEMNRIGSEINAENALSSARSDAEVLAGSGKDVTSGALDLAKIADPEYYQTRELGGNKLAELFGSLDLNEGLSGSERREVDSSLARSNSSRGLSDIPTSTNTVENAMTFGKEGANRMSQKQDAFGKALAQITSFLPSSKSGVDTFQQATGKARIPNPGAMVLSGPASGLGKGAFDVAANTLGSAGTLQNNAYSLNANREEAGAWDFTKRASEY